MQKTWPLAACPGGTCVTTYTWDALGQLVGVTVNTGAWATYTYDGWGRRQTRQTSTGGTEQFVYDGDQLWAVLDGAGNYRREYGYYPGGVDQPHVVRDAVTGQVLYVHQDALGNVVAATRPDGTLAMGADYDPWGWPEGTVPGQQLPGGLGWKGREWDDVLRGYANRARYYDPQLGRFLSEDPIGLAGGLNLYTYAGNDPINKYDPSGLMQQCFTWIEYDSRSYVSGNEIVVQSIAIPHTICVNGGDGGSRGGGGGEWGGGGGGGAKIGPSTTPPRLRRSRACSAQTQETQFSLERLTEPFLQGEAKHGASHRT